MDESLIYIPGSYTEWNLPRLATTPQNVFRMLQNVTDYEWYQEYLYNLYFNGASPLRDTPVRSPESVIASTSGFLETIQAEFYIAKAEGSTGTGLYYSVGHASNAVGLRAELHLYSFDNFSDEVIYSIEGYGLLTESDNEAHWEFPDVYGMTAQEFHDDVSTRTFEGEGGPIDGFDLAYLVVRWIVMQAYVDRMFVAGVFRSCNEARRAHSGSRKGRPGRLLYH